MNSLVIVLSIVSLVSGRALDMDLMDGPGGGMMKGPGGRMGSDVSPMSVMRTATGMDPTSRLATFMRSSMTPVMATSPVIGSAPMLTSSQTFGTPLITTGAIAQPILTQAGTVLTSPTGILTSPGYYNDLGLGYNYGGMGMGGMGMRTYW